MQGWPEQQAQPAPGAGGVGWGFGQGFMVGLWAGSRCSKGTAEPGQGQPVLQVQNCEQIAKCLLLRGQLENFLSCQGSVPASRHQMLLIF